jgi:hypothetical protein
MKPTLKLIVKNGKYPPDLTQSRCGAASVLVLSGITQILRREYGKRPLNFGQMNCLIARVADLEAFWQRLPKPVRRRLTKEQPQ